MNKWIEKSIKLANSKWHLDKLSKIYKIPDKPVERKISKEDLKIIRKAIKKARKTRNYSELVKSLLGIKKIKFPVDEPYMGFLRLNEQAIDNNPKTVNRIGKRLIGMGEEEIIKECKKPKSPSRQIGEMFRDYLQSLGYPNLPEKDFKKRDGIALLAGSDKARMKYANKQLGCKLKKGIDLLIKIRNRHVIGEAKFITTGGGSQNNQFRDAMSLIKSKKGNAIRIAIIDGVPWLEDSGWYYKEICKSRGIVLSALLLKNFIRSLKR